METTTNTTTKTFRHTARELNTLIREVGESGHYVYIAGGHSAPNYGSKMRITRARTKAGVLEVLSLATGKWHTVNATDVVEVA